MKLTLLMMGVKNLRSALRCCFESVVKRMFVLRSLRTRLKAMGGIWEPLLSSALLTLEVTSPTTRAFLPPELMRLRSVMD